MALRRRMGRDVEHEGGLPHGGPGRHDDQLRPLEAGGQLIQIFETAGNSRDRFAALLERFYALHRRPEHLLDPGEAFLAPLLRDPEDPALGLIEQLVGGQAPVVDLLDDAGGGLDEPAEDGFFADDAGVVVEIGGRRHRVHQLGEVFRAAGRIELAPAEQLVAQRDVVDHHPLLGHRHHGAEELAVGVLVEHRVVQHLGRAERRVLVEHHRAQYRLLRLRAPGSGPERLLNGREAVGRYGRHPRWASSSSGF